MKRDPHHHPLLQRLSDAIDEHGAPTTELHAAAGNDADAREFLDFWTGDVANTLAAPLPPCGIGLRQDILRLPDTSTTKIADTSVAIIEPPHIPAPTRRSRLSAAAAAAILIACGWLLYQTPEGPAPASPTTTAAPAPQPAAPTYTLTPGEVAAIQRDIDKGIAAAATPLAAVRMSLASLDRP